MQKKFSLDDQSCHKIKSDSSKFELPSKFFYSSTKDILALINSRLSDEVASLYYDLEIIKNRSEGNWPEALLLLDIAAMFLQSERISRHILSGEPLEICPNKLRQDFLNFIPKYFDNQSIESRAEDYISELVAHGRYSIGKSSNMSSEPSSLAADLV